MRARFENHRDVRHSEKVLPHLSNFTQDLPVARCLRFKDCSAIIENFSPPCSWQGFPRSCADFRHQRNVIWLAVRHVEVLNSMQ